MVVNNLNRNDVLRLLLVVGCFVLGALEREGDVLGGEIRAVLELHALAEVEDPTVGAGFPAFGQFGLKVQVGVAGDERFVDLPVHRDGRPFILGMGVHRQGVALAGPAQHILR